MENLFHDNPINYALKLVEDDFATEGELLCACLKFMSHDQIRDMLRENDLSPNVIETDEDEISNVFLMLMKKGLLVNFATAD